MFGNKKSPRKSPSSQSPYVRVDDDCENPVISLRAAAMANNSERKSPRRSKSLGTVARDWDLTMKTRFHGGALSPSRDKTIKSPRRFKKSPNQYDRQVSETSADTGFGSGFGMLNEKLTENKSPDNESLTPEKEEIYLVRQRYGYCSILFSIVQVIILSIMMYQCGVAPMTINPMIGPYPDALSEWGGKNAVNILDDGEWWRLITPIFLHAGVIHLLCNVAVQLETGVFFEREWGSLNWLIIYLVSAVGSSVLSVIFMPDAVSVGSSGAVMGLFGGKLAEVIVRFCESDKTEQQRIGHQVRREQCAGVTCSVIIVMLFSFIPFVDWSAHLGGLLAGFCIGMVLFALEIKKCCWKIFWFTVGVAITVVYFSVTLEHMYSGEIDPAEELRDVCGYYKQYFEDYECNCMREEMMANNG